MRRRGPMAHLRGGVAGKTAELGEGAAEPIILSKGRLSSRSSAPHLVSSQSEAEKAILALGADELKMVSQLTRKDLSASLAWRILEGAGQAPHIIIDAQTRAD